MAEARGLQEHDSKFDEHSVFSRLYINQQHINSDPRDYILALDLVNRLSFAATSDGDWITPSAASPSRLTDDIHISENPFNSVPGVQPKAWADLSFLIPKKAVTVPAIVQHSAEYDSSSSQAWYQRLWFHPHGRKLVESYAVSPETPVASFIDLDGVQQRFFSPHSDSLGAKAANEDIHPWKEICEGQDFTSSIFVDGNGT